jgi:hypothetical protein
MVEKEPQRLRAALLATVETVTCLIVPRDTVRLCWVQVHFTGGARRDYLVYHKPATSGAVGVRPAVVKAESRPDLAADIDLRKRGDAQKLEAYLAAENVETLAARMRDL